MKKVFFAAFFVFVFFVSCSNNNKDYIYGGFGDDDGEESEVTDLDRESYERPDEAPNPGGAGGSGNGKPSGSDGSNDDGNAVNDEDSESENDDENNDGDGYENTENPDESGEREEIYALEPDVGKCTSGIPSDNEKLKVLERINYIRSIHKLKPVKYDETYDEMAGECALVIAANKKLDHEPDKSWKCWSQVAYDGCYSSNISLATANNYDISATDSTTIVDGFFTEEDEVPPTTLGHRRWFIDPWLNSIAFGRADYSDGAGHFVLGSAVRVINRDNPDDQQDISDSDIKFVAYPFENYPAELYNDNVMMSFSVISDRTSKINNGSNINFDAADIVIIDPDNKTMKVKSREWDNQFYGVPNNLRWYAEGIKPNVKYKVTIKVRVNNNPESYQYWFELK